MKKRDLTPKEHSDITRAPRASRTKGYYRFTGSFPGFTDENGFRINETAAQRRRRIRLAAWKAAVIFCVVFAVSLCATVTALKISSLPADSANGAARPARTVKPSVIRLSGEILSAAQVEDTIQRIRFQGYNTVIIEFKDPAGNVYFRPDTAEISPDALYASAADADAVVASFQASGFTVYAAISCFADDIYARNHRDIAAYTTFTPENSEYPSSELWYDASSEPHAWLSPYADETAYYLNTVLSDVLACGVDGVMLEGVDVQAPAEVSFPGRTDASDTPSAAMRAYVSAVTGEYAGQYVIGVMQPVESALVSVSTGRLPEAALSGEAIYCIDFQTARIPVPFTVGQTVIESPAADYAATIRTFAEYLRACAAAQDNAPAVMLLVDSGSGGKAAVNALKDSTDILFALTDPPAQETLSAVDRKNNN